MSSKKTFAMEQLRPQWRPQWRAWWRRQSPVRQDRYAMIAPIVTVLLFLLALFLTIGYLRIEEADRERDNLKRDLDYSQIQLRDRLQDRKEQVLQVAKDIGRGLIDTSEFLNQSETLVSTTPELLAVVWVNNLRHIRSAYLTTGAYTMHWTRYTELNPESDAAALYEQIRQQKLPLYSAPYFSPDGRGLIQLQVPILGSGNRFQGVLIAELSLEGLLQHGISIDISKKYSIAFTDHSHQRLAGVLSPKASLAEGSLSWLTGLNEQHQYVADFELNNSERTPIEGDAALQLILRGYRTSQGFIGSALRLLVAALSLLTIWMLIANWQHTRRRLHTQDALLAETNFRRAMENSMPTGMRALDMEGRITYVNAAFCQMTQWHESDLVGCLPPYVYWPAEDTKKLELTLKQELSGNSSPGGVEMQVLRRDGKRFTARMYVSPLVDARGKQTGWMASMTDITEPKRIREELESSYERFITILEGLDASISVSTLGSKRLLFANKTYRQWFGDDAQDQPDFVAAMLAAPTEGNTIEDVDAFAGLPLGDIEDAPSESKEIYLPATTHKPERWLDVRVRYLNWVDGHLAQMVIANDFTAKHHAEAFAAEQAARAQASSRLITMGEMASSVAHELNQPLAAITNYCNGIVSRIHNNQISNEELLLTIEKTARQAQRAGHIIQRIRSFVTRSAPNRVKSDVGLMVSEAIDLVGIEVQRRRVQLTHHTAPDLPSIYVDPILIEQVVVNLIKNAAESIDSGGQYSPKDMAKRVIQVRVKRRAMQMSAEQPLDGIECTVEDTGPGVPPEVLARIFDAFFSTKSDGMGIGLNLCRSIIESHQGRLTAENLYNGKLNDRSITGCRFSFWLPLETQPQAASDLPD
ncbi:MAG: PAS domain S-box protein [Cytophagales bacterium]|nr:PAS domain S-box protein [Cytophagales bacterium]